MAASTTLEYEDLPGLLTLLTGDEKHDWSALSTLDVLWVLYDRVLRVDPAAPDDPERDRFLLSKGHGPAAYYASSPRRASSTSTTCATSAATTSPLGYHPDHLLVPGVEISSGSLGHGLPIAVGQALALDARGRDRARVFCLVGDAELDEGSNWEAVQLAGRLGLSRLTAIVVDNRSSTYHWPGGVAARFELEGWSAARVDGRDHDAIEQALRARRHGAARRRGGGGAMTHHAQALLRAGDARPRRGSARGAGPRRDRRLRGSAPRARLQRRHPRAAHDRRRGRPGLRGAAARRALLRALRRRAALRADQARPRPPGRRRRAREHRRVLRRLPVGPHAPGAGRRRAAVGAAGLDHRRSPGIPTSSSARSRAPSPATTASTSACPRRPTRRPCTATG